jgi:hypothetical protein
MAGILIAFYSIIKAFVSVWLCAVLSCVLSLGYLVNRQVYLEQYWNIAPEEEFFEKVSNILRTTSPNVAIRNRYFVNKLNSIYKKMDKGEKHKFQLAAFDNGLEPKLHTIIDDYKYAYE